MRRALLFMTVLGAFAGPTVARSPAMDDDRLFALLDPSRPSDAAILAAHEAVERDGSADAYIDLGNALRMGTFSAEARSAYQQATEVDPENSIAWNNLGIMETSDGDRDRASRSFREAIEVDPRNADARYNLAHILFAKGKFDEAVAEMKAVLLLKPELADPILNPRSSSSKLILPSRMAVYADTLGGITLGALAPDGSPQLRGQLRTPWLGLEPERERPTPRAPRAEAPAPESPPPSAAPAAPAAAPAPIVVSPAGVGPRAPAPAKPTTVKRGRRSLRTGGPLPPKPKKSKPSDG